MERNSTCSGIVLRNHRIGEIHKGVVILTDHMGLLSAIAHGAYSQKGRLRGVTNPFCTATFYLYHNPSKNSTKITDVEVEDFHQGLREDLGRFYAASLWAEIVVKSYGGGDDSKELYELLCRALSTVENIEASRVRRVSVQFVWRYLEIAGIRPNPAECVVSGRDLATADTAYSRVHGGFVAEGYTEEGDIAISSGARMYLRHTSALSLPDAVAVGLDEQSLASLQRALFVMVQDAVESPLHSLKIGEGFF